MLTLCLGSFSLQAQISKGQSTSQVLRTGNRAEEGNLGIYFGATSDMLLGLSNANVKLEALPLINLKYMSSDEFEVRCGIEWCKKSETKEAKANDTTESESKFLLSPGVAYHFNNRNLLDVYVGGEVPFGWGSYSEEEDKEDKAAAYFRFGLGAFIGLQAFIGNLPVAVGLEYGLGMNYRSVSDGIFTDSDNNIYQTNAYEFKEDVDMSRFFMGNQVRLTLSYYFDL